VAFSDAWRCVFIRTEIIKTGRVAGWGSPVRAGILKGRGKKNEMSI